MADAAPRPKRAYRKTALRPKWGKAVRKAWNQRQQKIHEATLAYLRNPATPMFLRTPLMRVEVCQCGSVVCPHSRETRPFLCSRCRQDHVDFVIRQRSQFPPTDRLGFQ